MLGLRYLDQLTFDEIAAVLQIGLSGQNASSAGTRTTARTAGGAGCRTLEWAVNDETRIDDDGDARLAELVAELAERLARGETPDVGNLETLDAEKARAIERLLPAIRLLSEPDQDQATRGQLLGTRAPGMCLGDFQIGEEIGRGGIGVVYEAVQISLNRRVAVKVLPPAALLDPRQMRRFEIEAHAAAATQHPGIVPVFAYGTEGGLPFFAMRLIEGRNLAEVIAERRDRQFGGLPPREVAALGLQAADALDYAHRNDVLHRDIKPSNLLIDERQRLWVADFGLARIRSDSDLTASGDVLGTLQYLSPEQASGRRGIVDGRTDIYGLGATLFELLTLRPVYEGDDRAELLIRIVADEPRFSRQERRGHSDRPEDDCNQGSGEGSDPPLSDGLRAGGRPPTFPRRRANPGPTGENSRASLRMVPSQQAHRYLVGRMASLLAATVVSANFALHAERARRPRPSEPAVKRKHGKTPSTRDAMSSSN